MSLEDFLYVEDDQSDQWGSLQEIERYRRIKVSVAAYAYEYHNHSFLTDADFDYMCSLIDVNVLTGNAKLDKYFGENFDPSTGQWIHKHPDLDGIKKLYHEYYQNRCIY